MKTKNSIPTLTKTFFIFLVINFFSSCAPAPKPVEENNCNDLGLILRKCKGHVIVVAKGYNSGNFKSYRHYMLLKDDSLNYYEYIGTDYKLSIGDTLK